MKVKSSNYHTSTGGGGADTRATSSKLPTQSIHQPVLSSNTNHLMSSSYKETMNNTKQGNKGGPTGQKGGGGQKNTVQSTNHGGGY